MTGSEDFNIYLWRVPKLNKDHVGIAKVEHSTLAIQGHRSIVNQVIFNRDTGMICSSGVEKIIKVSSIVDCRYSAPIKYSYVIMMYLVVMYSDENNYYVCGVSLTYIYTTHIIFYVCVYCNCVVIHFYTMSMACSALKMMLGGYGNIFCSNFNIRC